MRLLANLGLNFLLLLNDIKHAFNVLCEIALVCRLATEKESQMND